MWNIFCLILLIGFVGTIAAVIASYKRKAQGFFQPLNVAIVCVALTLFLGFYPKNLESVSDVATGFSAFIEAVGLSVVNTIQCFTVDMNGEELMETISAQDFPFKTIYICLMEILCTVAPILTMSAIITALMSVSAHMKYYRRYFKPMFIFSEMNERSITLAADIKRENPKAQIVFTDVLDKNDEQYYDLTGTAKDIGAILFQEDILTPKFHVHDAKAPISFFIMGENETENLNHTLTLIERYRDRDETRIYLFSSSRASELALSGVQKGKLKVRRINEIQSFIYHTLDEEGGKIFDTAIEKDGVKEVRAIVIGMGSFGTEMIKALAWYCQMENTRVFIDAFDADENAESRFAAICPDLLSPKYNHLSEVGESEYHITIHAGVDAETEALYDAFRQLGSASYVFVATGSDEKNVEIAANMRMIWKRLGMEPYIHAVVRNARTTEFLQNAVNYKQQSYGIRYIGSFEHTFSARVIINSALERVALERHMFWGDEASFWDYEYNYRSSVASVIHKHARDYCHVTGNDKLNEQGKEALTPEETVFLQRLEHCRWNAYMRAEGYTYGEKRDDIAKQHHCLVNFDALSQKDKDKDIW